MVAAEGGAGADGGGSGGAQSARMRGRVVGVVEDSSSDEAILRASAAAAPAGSLERIPSPPGAGGHIRPADLQSFSPGPHSARP